MTVPWPDPVVELHHPDTYATIRFIGDGFELWWTDGVANDWTELYPTLSSAIARMATLAACGESDWAKGFALTPPEFFPVATDFIGAAKDFIDSTLS